MQHSMSIIISPHDQRDDQGHTDVYTDAHRHLSANIEQMLVTARPRLVKFAAAQDVASDAIEDVVQETLIEAWRHLAQLQTPERFDAWLYGICRNMCARWKQKRRQAIARQTTLSHLRPCKDDRGETTWEETLADPCALDPVEALSSQDLTLLLDRALGYLPEGMRQAVEAHYLAGLPQQEAASRLGLTTKALEVRLVRARRRLRQILSGALYDEAEAFGLAIEPEAEAGWRETRIWCMVCGRHRLQGLFDVQPDGSVDLRLCCPNCDHYGRREWIKTGGLFELCGLKSFRPALKRSQEIAIAYWSSQSARRSCPYCKAPAQVQLLGPEESRSWLTPWTGLRFVLECPACGVLLSSPISMTVLHSPPVQCFIEEHPRWIFEPEALIEYAGLPAFRVLFADTTSSARLTLVLHCETLQVMRSFQE